MRGVTRDQLSRRNVSLPVSFRSLQTSPLKRDASVGSTSRSFTHTLFLLSTLTLFCPFFSLQVKLVRKCFVSLQVSGLPAPDISWYLDGKAIRPDDYHKMLVCEKGMHSFIIEIVTVHHAGVYECVAKNRAGENRFTLRLDVIGINLPSFLENVQ